MMASPHPVADSSAGELMSRVSADLSQLIRDELRLAQAETSAKARKLGLGLGMFGAAGLIALCGAGALVAAAILGLATAVHAWLAALFVGVALLFVAAVVALTGKRDVRAAAPPIPTETVTRIKSDVHALREGVRR